VGSRIEKPEKAAISLKVMITIMKKMETSVIRLLMRRGHTLSVIISALVRRQRKIVYKAMGKKEAMPGDDWRMSSEIKQARPIRLTYCQIKCVE
jgi:hypothetical protein